MIRLDLRDLINTHKPINELNNNNNTDNNDNNTDCGEWKIQLSIIISCISTKNFSEKRTMCSKSKAVEVYMGSDTEDVIDTLLIHYYEIFRVHKKHQMKEEANLFLIVL